MKQDLQLLAAFYAGLLLRYPGKYTQYFIQVGTCMFLRIEGGVRIYAMDGSYKRFIADSWYDGVDPESL